MSERQYEDFTPTSHDNTAAAVSFSTIMSSQDLADIWQSEPGSDSSKLLPSLELVDPGTAVDGTKPPSDGLNKDEEVAQQADLITDESGRITSMHRNGEQIYSVDYQGDQLRRVSLPETDFVSPDGTRYMTNESIVQDRDGHYSLRTNNRTIRPNADGFRESTVEPLASVSLNQQTGELTWVSMSGAIHTISGDGFRSSLGAGGRQVAGDR